MAYQREETIDVLDKVEEFFLYDDRSRWKAIGWIIAIAGSLGTVDFVFREASVDDTVLLMATIILLTSVTWVGWYCLLRRNSGTEILSPRRSLMFQGSASAIALLVGTSLWRFQARSLTFDLLQATKKNDYVAAKYVIERARAADIYLDKAVITNTGQRFISTPDQPAAWDAALALVDYRTVLNAGLSPKFPNPAKAAPNTRVGKYEFTPVMRQKPGTKGGGFWITTGQTSTDPQEDARMELLSKPQREGSGVNKILFASKEVDLILDDQYLKNVIVSDTDVYYYGGPVRLENVIFINCRFHFANQRPSRELGESILRASAVNFSQDMG